eukprot:gene18526-biopygen2424
MSLRAIVHTAGNQRKLERRDAPFLLIPHDTIFIFPRRLRRRASPVSIVLPVGGACGITQLVTWTGPRHGTRHGPRDAAGLVRCGQSTLLARSARSSSDGQGRATGRATGRASGRAAGHGGVGVVRVKHSPRSLRSLVE